MCSECRMPEPAVMNCTEPRPSDSRVPMESSYGASACRVDNYVGDNLLGIARAAGAHMRMPKPRSVWNHVRQQSAFCWRPRK